MVGIDGVQGGAGPGRGAVGGHGQDFHLAVVGQGVEGGQGRGIPQAGIQVVLEKHGHRLARQQVRRPEGGQQGLPARGDHHRVHLHGGIAAGVGGKPEDIGPGRQLQGIGAVAAHKDAPGHAVGLRIESRGRIGPFQDAARAAPGAQGPARLHGPRIAPSIPAGTAPGYPRRRLPRHNLPSAPR